MAVELSKALRDIANIREKEVRSVKKQLCTRSMSQVADWHAGLVG